MIIQNIFALYYRFKNYKSNKLSIKVIFTTQQPINPIDQH